MNEVNNLTDKEFKVYALLLSELKPKRNIVRMSTGDLLVKLAPLPADWIYSAIRGLRKKGLLEQLKREKVGGVKPMKLTKVEVGNAKA